MQIDDVVTEEAASQYVPQVWAGGCEDLHHCLKKALWMKREIFNCCAASTSLSCVQVVEDIGTGWTS